MFEESMIKTLRNANLNVAVDIYQLKISLGKVQSLEL